MNRFVAMFLGMAVTLGVIGTLYMYVMPDARSASLGIMAIAGEVALEQEGQRTPAKVGHALQPGDRVVTGEDGSAILSRDGGSPIRLSPSTEVQLVAMEDEVVELELEKGRVRAKVRPDAGAVRLTSRGRSVLATDADMVMAITPSGDLSVQSDRGVLAIAGVSGAHTLGERERLHSLQDGSVATGPIPSDLLLKVAWPGETQQRMIDVAGTTEPASTVYVLRPDGVEPVSADSLGAFSLRLPLVEGRNQVELEVADAFGKRRRARGEIVRDTEAPGFRLTIEHSK